MSNIQGQGIRMDDSAREIVPIGNRVLLQFKEIAQPQPEPEPKEVVEGEEPYQAPFVPPVLRAYIEAVGKDVDMKLYGFKIGDWVMFDGNSVTAIDLPDVDTPEDYSKIRRFGMTCPENIWGVYSE